MAAIITDPDLESRLIAERQLSGGDRFDEVWEGTYIMSPLADIEHQRIQSRLTTAFQAALGMQSPALVLAGVNVSDREKDWKYNYRCPDVAVVFPTNPGKNCGTHWFGGPDLAVEIVSPHDRSRKKLDFYSSVGVRELLIIDRNPWAIELYRLHNGALELAGRCTPADRAEIASEVLPIRIRFEAEGQNIRIIVTRTDQPGQWTI